jgi:hypothetical protein
MHARRVSLVLVSSEGRLLGQTAQFPVELPWWQEMGDVVDAARRQIGIGVRVLRLLAAEKQRPHGGRVVYLAETDDAPPEGLLPPSDELRRRASGVSPRRADWAQIGGHRRSLAWARSVWPEGGDFTARQHRAWNLSSLWELAPAEGAPARTRAWLKQVPPFLAHEATVVRWLATVVPSVSPAIMASDGAGRMLLEHIDGDDCYGAPAEQRLRFASAHHQIQLASLAALATLERGGVPDRRGDALTRHLRGTLSGRVSALPGVARFLDGLDSHMARLDECGLPQTLVHGDFHPGNVRAAGSTITILDWGDSFLGNPAFDLLRLSEGLGPAETAELEAHWAARWREHRRGCDPERAVALLRPLVAVRAAATYAHFVEHIEASERPFHAFDVTDQLELAERALAGGASPPRA